MTGGIEETYDLKELPNKHSFFDNLGNALAHDAMMGCSINGDPNIKEGKHFKQKRIIKKIINNIIAKLPNGLIRGHAYAMTAVVTLNVNNRVVRLVRCRNPWGNDVEWNGSWSDKDPIWQSLPIQDRENLGQKTRADGEFWISYEDWVNNFDIIQICNISPDSLKTARSGSKWNCIQYDGEWIIGRTAGGCGQGYDKQKFWSNPQYLSKIHLKNCNFFN